MVNRKRAAGRSSGEYSAIAEPAASAAADVVVITISRVPEVTAGRPADRAGVQPMDRVHPGQHRRGHAVGHAADGAGQASDGIRDHTGPFALTLAHLAVAPCLARTPVAAPRSVSRVADAPEADVARELLSGVLAIRAETR